MGVVYVDQYSIARRRGLNWCIIGPTGEIVRQRISTGAEARDIAHEMNVKAIDDVSSVKAPDLAPHEGSWVATFDDGRVVEFFTRANADKAAQIGCTVETIGTYLGRINRAAAKA